MVHYDSFLMVISIPIIISPSYHHHITIIISPLYYSIGYIFCIPIPISPENPIKIDLRKPTPI